MASSANSSTQNPPRKLPRTDYIDISSNETSPIQNHFTNTSQSVNPTNATIDTTFALTIPPPTTIQTILTQGTIISHLAPIALVFSTPPSSPLELHPYLTSLNDLPPRNSNPLSQTLSQGLFQTLPLPIPMDFEPSFPPINLSRSRLSAQPEPFLNKEQVLHQLSQYQDFDHHIEESIQNAQNVQNSLLPPFTTTSLQMPPPHHFTTSSTTTTPPLDHHSYHLSPLFLLINPHGLKDTLLHHHKNTLIPIVNAPKPLLTISKMK
ncbi:hypothetical protein Tco_1411343 [Tanacetum coccineum]